MDYPDYDPALAVPPLDEAELDALDEMLRALPAEGAMNVEALDGYLTALLLGPRPLPPSAQWMPSVWGGDGDVPAPFASGKQRKKAVVGVLRHLHALDLALERAAAGEPEAWEPVVSVAETADGDEQVDAEDWCAGFLQGVALAPAVWAPRFDDARLGPLLVPLALLGGDPSALAPADAARLSDPAERDALSRAALDVVPSLKAAATAG